MREDTEKMDEGDRELYVTDGANRQSPRPLHLAKNWTFCIWKF